MADKRNMSFLLGSSVVIIAIVLCSVGSAKLQIKAIPPQEPTTTQTPVDVNQRPLTPITQDQCVPFHNHYCSKFGYNRTVSPNPWARDLTMEQALQEFNDFNNLLRSNCSDKLATFLCFTYFPLCYELPNGGSPQIVLPCRETCDQVHESGCNDLVMRTVGQWGEHLQCSNFRTKLETENGNCAAGENKGDKTMTEDGDGGETFTPMVPPSTTEAIKASTDEEADICEDQSQSECQTKCNVRSRSIARTFINNHYTYAAKVSVVQKLTDAHHCRHAYQVEVLQQFNLSSPQPDSSSQPTFSPAMQRHIIVETSTFTCSECPVLVVGRTYLIAGQYRHNTDNGSTVWELPNGKKNSLVSEWKGMNGQSYNTKLHNWIVAANQYRLQKKNK